LTKEVAGVEVNDHFVPARTAAARSTATCLARSINTTGAATAATAEGAQDD
jgi:hypothetical protein